MNRFRRISSARFKSNFSLIFVNSVLKVDRVFDLTKGSSTRQHPFCSLMMTAKSKLNFILHQVNWPMVVYLSLAHILAFIGLFRYLTVCKWETWVWSLLLVFWTEVGITGGAHRLWSHRSYHAHWTVRLFYMLLASIANEGSIYHWVRDHRTHHKYSETDADPHNVSITVFKSAKMYLRIFLFFFSK